MINSEIDKKILAGKISKSTKNLIEVMEEQRSAATNKSMAKIAEYVDQKISESIKVDQKTTPDSKLQLNITWSPHFFIKFLANTPYPELGI